jgi:hypothetical protein
MIFQIKAAFFMFDSIINFNIKHKIKKSNIIKLSDIDYTQTLIFNINFYIF